MMMDELLSLNIRALTRLTYAAVPGFVERGHGMFINIASIVGIAPEMLNGVYGASKAYVIAFTHSLEHELASKGIRVQAVLPGPTATEFWDIGGLPVSNLPQETVMTADNLVDAALSYFDVAVVDADATFCPLSCRQMVPSDFAFAQAFAADAFC